jgi:uncharacterized protein YqjF (DUF2071 family)
MFASLQRHPFSVEAFFEYSLVLTFALPEAILAPMLPPGLMLDSFEGNGFVAIALVQTKALRPKGLPQWLGKDFFLSGYRIFTRHRTTRGQTLRGLFILRSDADSRGMVQVGNLLTHYRYRFARVSSKRNADTLSIDVQTPSAEADLALHAQLGPAPAQPPAGSPFPDWATARRFAGPLPYTFDYEAATESVVLVKGVRKVWEPRPVAVSIARCTFFEACAFNGATPQLANAFFLENVPYHWKRGVLSPLNQSAA